MFDFKRRLCYTDHPLYGWSQIVFRLAVPCTESTFFMCGKWYHIALPPMDRSASVRTGWMGVVEGLDAEEDHNEGPRCTCWREKNTLEKSLPNTDA